MQNEPTYKTLVAANKHSFEQLYEICVESFPINERKSKILFSEMVSNPDYKVTIVNKDDATIGFSIVFTPKDRSFCLLEYMAIHQKYRNLGLGKNLFLYTVNSYCKNTCCLLEIDSDNSAA